MPSFSCDRCSDVVKKPKLDAHSFRCKASVTCLDCSTTFPDSNAWKSHTSCISEAQKYEKTVYKPPKDKKNKQVNPQVNGREASKKITINNESDISTRKSDSNDDFNGEKSVNKTEDNGGLGSELKTAEKRQKENMNKSKDSDNLVSTDAKKENTEVEKAENGVKKKKKKKEKKKEGDTPKETKVDSQSLLETLKLLKSKLLAETISVSKDDQFADLKSEKKLDGCTNLNQGLDTKKVIVNQNLRKSVKRR
ncbi:expressed protein [Phakopsora pachyrhizi]|uniref:Expressed protein n=1 Tax=Phakopsora pachyrhizi TaxID=170000 RepID=A0AAV0AIP3_PHAPC|nr:expressed protein [Phakopsora pachyrhizi]